MYNLTVYNITENIANWCMWDESQAAWGSNEIGSCVLDYISCEKYHHIEHFIFYSEVE
jgi:hypothetical protein